MFARWCSQSVQYSSRFLIFRIQETSKQMFGSLAQAPKRISFFCQLKNKQEDKVRSFKKTVAQSSFFQKCCHFCWNQNTFERNEDCATAQCCVFNNYSIVKHRHQFWDKFLFSFDSWNTKVALNFATNCHKN